MSTIIKHIPHTVDLNEPVRKTYIDTLLATEDNLAHCFDITLKQEIPGGAAVNAYFIRYSDNATISLTGTVSGNMASVTLNKSCYNKAGQYAVIIKVVADGVTNTVFYGEGTIFTSITDTILDPENVVPSLSDLLAQIAAMEAATAASKTATTNAKTATTRANNAAAKIEGMTASATEAEEAGVTVSEVDGVKHFDFALPRGEKGEKGDPGTIENVTITSISGLPEALDSLSQQKANQAGWTPNKLIGTDADGNLVAQDLPEDNGGDADTLGGKEPKYYIQPRNLLDNSDFRNPVNQRGATSKTFNNSVYQYFVDRWCHVDWSGNSDGTLTISGDGITATNEMVHFYQRFEPGYLNSNKTYTLALYYSDGTIELGTDNYQFEIAYKEEYIQVRFTLAAGKTISMAALYEGEYTADNLPPYVPKGYAVELAECQRYYQKYPYIGLTCRNNGGASILLPVKMHRKPDVFLNGRYLYTDSANDVSSQFLNSIGATTERIEFLNGFYDGYINIVCTGVELTADL